MTCLEAAREYLALGLHPIPCAPRDKRPLIAWRRFQNQAPTAEQIESWWTQWPDANVALVLGRGIFAVDLDGDGAEMLLLDQNVDLPETAPRVRTGAGQHTYLAADVEIANRTALLSTGGHKPQVDIRGTGGYVLAPPSIHPSGSVYEWLEPLSIPPPQAPASLLQLLARPSAPAPAPAQSSEAQPVTASGSTQPRWIAEALKGVGEGQRDDTCARLAGYFVGKGVAAEIVTALLIEWGARCTPPFSERDVRKTIVSIVRKHGQPEPESPPESEDGEPKRPLVEHVSTAIEVMLYEYDHPTPVVATPYAELNNLLIGGFRAGELVYLGARPGVGKTVFALEVARHVAKLGLATLMISREMLLPQLAQRMVAQEGRIPASQLRRGKVDGELIPAMSDAMAKLCNLPLWISDKARTVSDLQACLDQVPQTPELLIVDYLQLIQSPGNDRRLQIESVSAALMQIALSRKIPVLCLSSLSRPASGDKDKKPTMGSLRETGQLEHDAHIVLLLHREQGATDAECIVAKARSGKTGSAHLVFNGQYVSFEAKNTFWRPAA